MPTIGNSQDGARLTVAQMVNDPTHIPRVMLSMINQQFFVGEEILRDAGSAPGGAAVYYTDASLFAQDDAEVVAEGAEIPVTIGSEGTPQVARAKKRALGIEITQEMIDENKVDRVNQQMLQVVNSFKRGMEDAFLAMVLGNPNIPTMASTTGDWSTATNIRSDVSEVKFRIKTADADTSNGTGRDKYGFRPDVMLVSDRVAADLEQNPDIWKLMLSGPLAAGNPQYTGELPEKLMGLRLRESWRLPDDKIVFAQSKIVGGIQDTRPLRITPMYEIKQREVWRCDVSRKTLSFIDNPKAALILTGLT